LIKTIATEGKGEELIQKGLWKMYVDAVVICVSALKYKTQIKIKDGF
jgi:hypothetical protein